MFLVIRVRGRHDIRKDVKDTLKMLKLNRVNHAVLVNDSPEQKSKIQKAGAYVTFGEIEENTLIKLLEKRARQKGDNKLGKEFFKKIKVKDSKELAKILLSSKKKLKEFGIKPVFRLHPPKKGYERAGIKKTYSVGGALGYRGIDINKIALKMI